MPEVAQQAHLGAVAEQLAIDVEHQVGERRLGERTLARPGRPDQPGLVEVAHAGPPVGVLPVEEGERVRREGLDGVVCIGGGSVMCTGKGVAIVATNNKPMRDCTGVGRFSTKALPMIMVPTTAGSGSEVSQWTIVKDEERHLKLLGGGPLSFPDAAVLDPVTLGSLPMHVAVLPAVDALTHGVEAYLSGIASPLTDAVALAAVRLQAGSMRASINSDDPAAREENLVASCMANVACGNARLGHAHALSLPLEGQLDLAHPVGVGVLYSRR